MNATLPTIDAAALKHFENEGYIVLRGAFSKQRIAALLSATNRVLDAARARRFEVKWIDPAKQYPTMIGRLLHPDKYQPEYSAWIDEDLSPHLEALLDNAVRYSLVTLFSCAPRFPYLMEWHRDLVRLGTTDEPRHLARHDGQLVQFNAPLLECDDFLQIVPHSHNRASTREDFAAAAHGAFKRADPSVPVSPEEVDGIRRDDAPHGMPGAMVLKLDPGDIAFYNANIWHRGFHAEGKARLTLAAAWWRKECPVMLHEHGQREALLTPGHLDRLPPITRQYIRRYLDVYPEGKPTSAVEG